MPDYNDFLAQISDRRDSLDRFVGYHTRDEPLSGVAEDNQRIFRHWYGPEKTGFTVREYDHVVIGQIIPVDIRYTAVIRGAVQVVPIRREYEIRRCAVLKIKQDVV